METIHGKELVQFINEAYESFRKFGPNSDETEVVPCVVGIFFCMYQYINSSIIIYLLINLSTLLQLDWFLSFFLINSIGTGGIAQKCRFKPKSAHLQAGLYCFDYSTPIGEHTGKMK